MIVHGSDGKISKCFVECDCNGNIFLKYNDQYYTLSLDCEEETGITLCRIRDPKHYIKSRMMHIHKKKEGKIHNTQQTLKGKVKDKINNMDDEEKDDFIDKNHYTSYDRHFKDTN